MAGVVNDVNFSFWTGQRDNYIKQERFKIKIGREKKK
jgi:hypothetical protein